MLHLDKDKKNILMGAVVGGIVGIGASIFIAHTGKNKKSTLDMIGKTMCQLGEILENAPREGKTIFQEVEKNIHKDENALVTVLELTVAGINLWKKLKNGS